MPGKIEKDAAKGKDCKFWIIVPALFLILLIRREQT